MGKSAGRSPGKSASKKRVAAARSRTNGGGTKATPKLKAKLKPGAKHFAPAVVAENSPDRITGGVLDRLYGIVLSRRDADPSISHSARLLSRGTAKVAQKFGEEAVECLIEAVAGNRDALAAESADVLYHLMVLWVAADLHPEQVWQELVRREGISGIAEKASRPLALSTDTPKIP